jgi:regulator of protease activity HflC (stomatin/prohibitin superfamily)
MKNTMIIEGHEKVVKPISGYGMLIVGLIFTGLAIFLFTQRELEWLGGISILVALLTWSGLIVVDPNNSRVLILFGSYKGTVKQNGFFFVNPLMIKKKISLRARNLETPPIKVNDKMGNPIMIGAVLVWKVENTYRAAFEVEKYEEFVKAQSESAIRQLAGAYSYDNIEDETATTTLRSSHEEINRVLEKEIAERLSIAGIVVIEARISHLAYASEIAGAMLQRQQATAVVAARQKIVEGAVGMVEMALNELSKKEIVHLDDERKAAMVSNLMVVLCSDKNPTPVVNAGTLYQ